MNKRPLIVRSAPPVSPNLELDLMRGGAPWLGRLFRPELGVLVAIFVVFFFYRLANYSLQIDDELAVVRETAHVWLMQGRWVAYLLESWLLANPVMPFVATFLFGLFASIGYLVLLSAHEIDRPGVVHYAAFPLFVAFPTWIPLSAFSANIAAAGLALLLCCMATHAFRTFLVRRASAERRDEWPRLAASALLVAVATGIYQSFLFAAAALGLGVLLIRSLQPSCRAREILVEGLWLLAVLAAGALSYTLINKLFLTVTGVADGGYVGNIANIGHFLADPAGMLRAVLIGMGGIYGGHAEFYGLPAPAFPVLLALGLIAAIAAGATRPVAVRLASALIVAAVLITPFIMHALSGGMPLRSLVSVPAVIWLLAMVGLTCGRRWIELLSSVALVVSLVTILVVGNGMQAVDSAARSHDSHLAADLYRRMAEAKSDFDVSIPQVVDVHGAKPFASLLPRPWSSSWGYSFFEWDGGNLLRMLSYMRLQGYDRLVAASPAQREANLVHFRSMPTWPAAGSVQVVDGVILIKLSDDPGYPFNAR